MMCWIPWCPATGGCISRGGCGERPRPEANGRPDPGPPAGHAIPRPDRYDRSASPLPSAMAGVICCSPAAVTMPGGVAEVPGAKLHAG